MLAHAFWLVIKLLVTTYTLLLKESRHRWDYETDLVQRLTVEDSGPLGYRTDWSEPWLPWSRPSPLTLGCGSWRQDTGNDQCEYDQSHARALACRAAPPLTCTVPLQRCWSTAPLLCSCDTCSPRMFSQPGHSSVHVPSEGRITVRVVGLVLCSGSPLLSVNR